MRDEDWSGQKARKAKAIVQYMIDNVNCEEKMFSVFLCLRLVIKPTDILVELRDRLYVSKRHLSCKADLSAKTTCRRVKRGSNLAQSFSFGTVTRSKFNRRSVRINENQINDIPVTPSEENNNDQSVFEENDAADAFDEILTELENVRVSLPKQTSQSSRFRSSSAKQRPYSSFVSKTNFTDQEETNDRDSGYLSQHNSQSSVSELSESSSIGSDQQTLTSRSGSNDYSDDVVIPAAGLDSDVFNVLDFWSFHLTGDLRPSEAYHLLMEILDSLRNNNQISFEQSYSILLRVNHHQAMACVLPKPVRSRFTKKSLKTKPFVLAYEPPTLAQRLTQIEHGMLRATSPEHFIERKDRNALDCWAEWFNSLSHLSASQVCLASNTSKAAKVIDHLIEVAMECCELGNWNSAMAIALGMNLTPVIRLSKTWSKVNSTKLALLKQISDPAKNFKNYRSKVSPECSIPFVSLLVKDACFQAQECKSNFELCFNMDFKNFRHINQSDSSSIDVSFRSFQNLADPLYQLNKRRQKSIAQLDEEDELLNLVQTPVLDEDLLYMASFKLESASNQFDRNMYKQLKTKIFN